MGLFDSIMKLAQTVSDTVSEVTSDGFSARQELVQDAAQRNLPQDAETQRLEAQAQADARPFDEKLQEVVMALGGSAVVPDISPDLLEARIGRQLYPRGGKYRLPQDFTYAVVLNGRTIYIRLWKTYQEYNHIANRNIRSFCDSNGIKVLDFFEYLPNGVGYMKQRISDAFAA